jgi:hypothetical protein
MVRLGNMRERIFEYKEKRDLFNLVCFAGQLVDEIERLKEENQHLNEVLDDIEECVRENDYVEIIEFFE